MSNAIDVCQTGYDYEQFLLNELEDENMKLKKKLDIAVKALKSYANKKNWRVDNMWDVTYYGYKPAQEALKEMEE